ncbi:hypothetical protein CVIRNUC_003495 [Coccomyxa viridis]|uniref:Uncharacterized protein n=1 Tax=Coccomyxa viridis TaxID=1274662 RepID=A0AAV1I2J1_9CHLO|nr:hypothetical protein CVIRNUC_003495 [Coccomyxa viridis]
MDVSSFLAREKTCFKISDHTSKPSVKYVFVGEREKSVEQALQRLALPGIMNHLESTTIETIEREFGPDWMYVLGLYRFPASPASHRAECMEYLAKIGCDTWPAYRKQYRDITDSRVRQCGRVIFAQELLKGYERHRCDEIVFVQSWTINLDDSIKAIKQKVFLTVKHHDYYLRPEWQCLFTAEGVMGTGIIDRSQGHRKTLKFTPDPMQDLEHFLAKKRDQTYDEILRRLQNRSLHTENLQDTLLYDYTPIDNDEIRLVPLPAVLDTLVKRRADVPQWFSKTQDMYRVFLQRYFLQADKTGILRVLDGQSVDMMKIGKEGFGVVREAITATEASTHALQRLEITVPRLDSCIRRVAIDVPSGSDKDLVNLSRLYEGLTLDSNTLFISLRGGRKGRETPDARYKVKSDVQYIRQDIKLLRSWVFPLDADSKRPNQLTLRLRLHRVKNASVRLLMIPDGSYTILILWTEHEAADIRDVMDTLRVVKEYITRHMLPMPYKLDRRSDHAIPIPDVQTPAIKSMQHTMVFDNPRGLDFIALKNLAMCFAPYIALNSEMNEISKFWKRIPRYGAILKKLSQKGLFDLSTLSALTTKEWSQLDLIPSAKANKQFVDEFQRHIQKMMQEKISFFYKRHTRYESSLIQRKIVSDYLIHHNIGMADVYENSDHLSGILKELHHRLNLTTKEATEILRAMAVDVESLGKSSSARVSTGIKCDISQVSPTQCRLTIFNIKNFSEKSSVAFTLESIAVFFYRFLWIYNHTNDLAAYARQNPKMCSADASASLSAVEEEDAKELEGSGDGVYSDDISEFIDMDLNGLEQGLDVTGLDGTDNMEEAVEGVVSSDLVESAEDAEEIMQDGSTSSHNIVSMGSSKKSYHLARLEARDPYVFVKDKNKGWTVSFASRCVANQHVQPIVLTEEEYLAQDPSTFAIPGALPDGFKYRGLYYICPEFWCPQMNRAVHGHQLSDVQWSHSDFDEDGQVVPKIVQGKCPTGEDAYVANYGLAGWKAAGINKRNPDQGRKRYPGFCKPAGKEPLHPDGVGVPCCFQQDQSSKGDTVLFFQLLSGQPAKARQRAHTESNRRYKLGPTKVPVDDMRFGSLIEVLDVFFNGEAEKDKESKIFGQDYDRFLRVGVEQHAGNSFFSCILAIANLYFGETRFPTLASFRSYVAENLTDELLVRTLKNGNVKIVFEDFAGDDYMAKFRAYILSDNDVDFEYVWDLVSRPLPWLFKDGLNIFVIEYDREHKCFFKCPKGEIVDNFYRQERDGVFLVYDGRYFEPVARLNNALEADPFMRSYSSFKRMRTFMNRCRRRSISTMTPVFVVERLKQSKELFPQAQVVNAFNKVRAIVTIDGTIIPVEQGYGPVLDHSIGVINVEDMPTMSLNHFNRRLALFKSLFYPDCEPATVLLDDEGKPAALMLQNYLTVPIAFSKSYKPHLPISKDQVYREIDRALFDRDVVIDDRITDVSQFFFLRETLERYRMELSRFLQEDLRKGSDRNFEERFWFRINSVLKGSDQNGMLLPLWAKRSLLADIFLHPKNGLQAILVSTNKLVQKKEYVQDLVRRPCSTPHGVTQDVCDNTAHCAWDRRCKLYIPKRFVQTFTMLIIEDLLRGSVKRDMIMEGRIDSLIRSERIRIRSEWIEFDTQVAEYVLYVMEHFDMRKMKEATILDYLDAGVPQAETAMRKLKEALVFKGFMDFPQQPLGSSAKLIPLTGAALESIGPGCYIGERCSVYTTIAYAVSNLLDRPTFTVGHLRQDILDGLREDQKLRRSYTRHLQEVCGAQRIATFEALARFVETGSWQGCLADVAVVATIYPLSLRVVWSDGRQACHPAACSETKSNLPGVTLFHVSSDDLRLVYRRKGGTLALMDRSPPE